MKCRKLLMQALRRAFAIPLCLAAASAQAQVPAPSAPAYSTGSYTVSYAPCTGCVGHGLYERPPGSVNWTHIGSGAVSFTNRPEGTYRYRVHYAYWSGRLVYTLAGPEISVVVTAAGPAPERPPLSAQLSRAFEVRGGDIDGDGRRDLLLRPIGGVLTAEGTLGFALLRQSSDGKLQAMAPSQSALAIASAWPLTGIRATIRDVNIDGFVDVLLTGISRQPGYQAVNDQIVFAPALPGTNLAPRLTEVDAALVKFARDIGPHLMDPEYFPTNVPLQTAVIVYYDVTCSYLGYPDWAEIGYFWPCYPAVGYYYVVYRDFSAFDRDALQVASHDYEVIHGTRSAEHGLQAIENVLEGVLNVQVGGWDIGQILDGSVSDQWVRRGIELFAVLGAIMQAAADENGDPVGAGSGGNLDRVLLTGRRVLGHGPYHTALQYGVSTVSAFDDDPRALFDGTLVSQVNWPNDHPLLTMPLGAVDGPSLPAAYWAAVLFADGRYGDDLPYDTFPSIGAGGYNSNSFVSGLIQATAGRPTVPMTSFVGGERPVPLHEFR